MFNDGTNPTAGIDKDYHNGFTAILSYPKIDCGPESALTVVAVVVVSFTLAENVKLGMLIRIRLKKVTSHS